MTEKVSAKRNLARARRLMNLAAKLGVEYNKEDILRRIEAWDAQVVRMKRKYSSTIASETSSGPGNLMRQLSLELGARSTWPFRNKE